jgi:hypothetical protein
MVLLFQQVIATARFHISKFRNFDSNGAVAWWKFRSATGATEEWNFGVYSYSAAAWASGGNLNSA